LGLLVKPLGGEPHEDGGTNATGINSSADITVIDRSATLVIGNVDTVATAFKNTTDNEL